MTAKVAHTTIKTSLSSHRFDSNWHKATFAYIAMNVFFLRDQCLIRIGLMLPLVTLKVQVKIVLYPKPLELQLGGKGTQPHELRRTK